MMNQFMYDVWQAHHSGFIPLRFRIHLWIHLKLWYSGYGLPTLKHLLGE